MTPVLLHYVLFFLCIIISSCANNLTQFAEDTLQDSHGKIIYSSVLFRHGDRTIKAHYPNDPYPAYIWSEGLLQLTKRGKLQAYNLGKWYRKRYDPIIGDQGYNHTMMLMNSTDTDRALMSGELFLAAMFPPTEDEIWSDDGLKWQPIPVHSTPEELDRMAGASADCDRYDLERSYWSSTEEVREFYRRYEKDFVYICENAGFVDGCSEDRVFQAIRLVWTVYNALYVEEAHYLVLPSWSDKIYPEPAKTISEFYFLCKTYSLEMRRLKGGPLLQNMISEMQQKRDGLLERQFHFYSAQETSISVFLHTLDVYDLLIPSYTASVMVELREKNSEYYVTLLYRNSTEHPPHLLHVPGCGDPCTLDKFILVTEYLIPENWDEECQVGFFETFSNTRQITLVTVLVLIVIGVAVFLLVKCCMRRKERQMKLDYDHL
jgi:lysosomal acid phosphatase